MPRGFASDNCSGVHPRVLQALAEANAGHSPAYGGDAETEAAIRVLRRHFGESAEVFFVFNGTAANVLSLQAAARSHEAVLCSEWAHIHVDECGAPEKFTGSKLVLVPSQEGKLSVASVEPYFSRRGDQHRVQPRVISISQTTERGTLYSASEIRELAHFAHGQGAVLHMDGARLANAAAALGVSLGALTSEAGVDILSFGGTKNGLLGGEAVLIFNRELARDFKFIRKQGMQLASKMRFISAQFRALLEGGLWLENARAANRMAALLGQELLGIAGVKLVHPVAANAVFAVLPAEHIPALQREYAFHVRDTHASEVRLMCSFDTTEGDVREFSALVRRLVNNSH